MSKDIGGFAFPSLNAVCTGLDSDGGERWDTEPSGGMTLRDYFAVHSGVTLADVGAFARESGRTISGLEAVEMLAGMRFSAADAMLAERAK